MSDEAQHPFGDLPRKIHALVEHERRCTADALGAAEDEFLRLKVQGVLECGEVLVVALTDGRERHIYSAAACCRSWGQPDIAP